MGEWKRGKYHGSGVMTWPDGRKYEGEWRNGKKEGQGTYTWHDEMGRQCKYEGEWKEDVKQGRGTLHFGNGTKHTGEWKANKAHGQGTKTWPRYLTDSASPPTSDWYAHLHFVVSVQRVSLRGRLEGCQSLRQGPVRLELRGPL